MHQGNEKEYKIEKNLVGDGFKRQQQEKTEDFNLKEDLEISDLYDDMQNIKSKVIDTIGTYKNDIKKESKKEIK